ncbi:hypothetical protein TS71_12275 [Mycolicibacterium neoaurum]|nr:hypothetical protein MyAD_20595 [Mycolicibacterium neoaurum]KJQ50117.1 hypothetical protein TS71_12275 [Mycolicibacterium neoaurum]
MLMKVPIPLMMRPTVVPMTSNRFGAAPAADVAAPTGAVAVGDTVRAATGDPAPVADSLSAATSRRAKDRAAQSNGAPT